MPESFFKAQAGGAATSFSWLAPNSGVVNGVHTFTSQFQIGTGWNGYRVVGLTDICGTGSLSILTIDPTGALLLYPNIGGTGTATFGPRIQVGSGWAGDTLDIADIDGDGKPDLLAVDAAGTQWCYPTMLDYSNAGGTGTKTYSAPTQIGSGWAGYAIN